MPKKHLNFRRLTIDKSAQTRKEVRLRPYLNKHSRQQTKLKEHMKKGRKSQDRHKKMLAQQKLRITCNLVVLA